MRVFVDSNGKSKEFSQLHFTFLGTDVVFKFPLRHFLS